MSFVLSILWRCLFPAMFNGMFFYYGGTEHVNSVWISWGGINLAYLLYLCVPSLTRISSNRYELIAPIYMISFYYAIIQFFIGIVFIALSLESEFFPVLVQGGGLCVYIILIISNLKANEMTQASLARQEQENVFIESNVLILKRLLNNCDSAKHEKLIERVFDQIKSSPSRSHASVQVLEVAVTTKIAQLGSTLKSDDASLESLVKEIITLLEERTNQLLTRN